MLLPKTSVQKLMPKVYSHLSFFFPRGRQLKVQSIREHKGRKTAERQALLLLTTCGLHIFRPVYSTTSASEYLSPFDSKYSQKSLSPFSHVNSDLCSLKKVLLFMCALMLLIKFTHSVLKTAITQPKERILFCPGVV